MVDIMFEARMKHHHPMLAGQLVQELQRLNSPAQLIESAKALEAELTELAQKTEAERRARAEKLATMLVTQLTQLRDFGCGLISKMQTLPGGKLLLKTAKLLAILLVGFVTLDFFVCDVCYWLGRLNYKIQWRNGGRPMPPYLDRQERRLYATMTPRQWKAHRFQQALDANPKAKELYEKLKAEARELSEQDKQARKKTAYAWKEWMGLLEENPELRKAWREANMPTWKDILDERRPAKPQPYW